MAISETVAAEVLAKCGRHCCICRRFRPLHLHIHHIRERSDGDDDGIDNLTAICISCHADVHTQTSLTRRFTERELKHHRDNVYQLVADGKLPTAHDAPGQWDELSATMVSLIRGNSQPQHDATDRLSAEATELLLEAVRQDTPIHVIEYDDGFAVKVGTKTYGENFNNRDAAQYRHAIDCLLAADLVTGNGSLLYISYHGFILADDLIAAASSGKVI